MFFRSAGGGVTSNLVKFQMKLKKTKEEIIDAYETGVVLKILGVMALIAGIVLSITLSGGSDSRASTVALLVGFLAALILLLIARQCPFCDSRYSPEYVEAGVFRVRKWGYRCEECNLTPKQVGECVDLLRRGLDIDKNAIARLNKREL